MHRHLACMRTTLVLVAALASTATGLLVGVQPATSATVPTTVPATTPTAATATTTTPATATTTTPTTAATPSPLTCGPNRLRFDKTLANNALTKRVSQLSSLSSEVNTSVFLTASDRATLGTDVANELAGIRTLQAKVPNDATCAQVGADGQAMVIDFRVYVVMTPQVHLSNTADIEGSVAGQLKALEPGIATSIAVAQSAGKNVATAEAASSDYNRQVDTALNSSAGISASVLSFTPASYPAVWPSFLGDRARLVAGRAALKQATLDLHMIESTVV
jgi:hypothetical protein